MPSEELVESIRTGTFRPTFDKSRDYKGPDFINYVEPEFYRGGIPAWNGLIIRDQLRKNGELVAFNPPGLGDIALRGYQVSPRIPEGIYKDRTLARVYFWKDGQQIMKRYRLISLTEIKPQQITEQVYQNLLAYYFEWAEEFWDRDFLNEITLGAGERISDGLDVIKREIEGAEVFAVWVEEGSLTENLSAVTGVMPDVGLLESLGLTEEEIQEQYTERYGNKNALPWLLTGAGLVTGNLWLSGLGLFLRFRNDR